MGLFDFDEIFFQQIKRTKKMVINQEIIDNIKRILVPGFDDEELDTIKDLQKKLLTRSMKKNSSHLCDLCHFMS